MTYELEFAKAALKKFDKLNPQIADQFIRKLEAILENPKIPKNKLSGSNDLYKIKLDYSMRLQIVIHLFHYIFLKIFHSFLY